MYINVDTCMYIQRILLWVQFDHVYDPPLAYTSTFTKRLPVALKPFHRTPKDEHKVST